MTAQLSVDEYKARQMSIVIQLLQNLALQEIEYQKTFGCLEPTLGLDRSRERELALGRAIEVLTERRRALLGL